MRLDNVLDAEGCSRPVDIIPLKAFKSSSGLFPSIISFFTIVYIVGSATFLACVQNHHK